MPTYEYICDKCNENYEQFLPLAQYKAKTKCPKCKKVGRKSYALRDTKPTFTQKLYPYWDRALNKVFNSPSDRKHYLKANNMEAKESRGWMSKSQEREMYKMRLGSHDPRLRRHAN